ncbi:hypothetical protein PISMIDRAFT_691003 [Pisolithus microcarpus 441]|uniref:Uncharacterized protein n=1 Tax=Pisolithus microcarpus 441 TaxID=765257 RepID=A0A0C9YR22_9AGAM|nr:hypothetical protein BKA83DRAFT_691003 [Pisolithus microcarpus]KIK10478.1 hypothetical protein PISMIDRAFT_691003 [Pisolithus microcarpus 441]
MAHVVGSARVQNRTGDAGTYLGAYSNCHLPHALGQHTFASAGASYGSKGLATFMPLKDPPLQYELLSLPAAHDAPGSTSDWQTIHSEPLPRKEGSSDRSDRIPDIYHQQHRKSLDGAAELRGMPGSNGGTLGPPFRPRRPALQNATVILSSCTHFWCIYMFYTIFLVLSRLRTRRDR